jgi:EAL domain-containing protein (putative c-di-GMP-specific phosphodiesterase class I)
VGYSSLETLIKQDIDELKLDKSIINEIENEKGYLICKNTVNLCKELNIEVVAEGVENKNQLEIIKNLNIDLVQGFLFSKGISLKEAVKFAKEFELKNFIK